MKTVTVTQEEFDRWVKYYDGDRLKMEKNLNSIVTFQEERKGTEFFSRLLHGQAKLMLGKLTFEKYDVKSIEIDGKGVDRYITYMEYKDGTPLTIEELEGLDSDMQWDLMSETGW